MREILFRGKRLDNGEWVFGAYFCLHHNDERTHLHHFIIPENTPIPKEKSIGKIQVEVIPETIGQYIFTDRNGKKIFEGDIVLQLDDERKIGVMEYFEKECKFCAKTINKLCPNYKLKYFWFGNNKEIEAIGNVTDNPELLGGD